MFSYTTCVDCGGLYTCTLYIFRFWSLSPLLGRSSFRVQICGESTLGLNWEISAFSFLFSNFYMNNASMQSAKRALIVVIICLFEECFQHNQCFNQWSPLAPAKYIFYRATKRRLYLIRKSGGKKPGLWHFLGSYILYHQSFATWRNWKTWAFSCINLTTNMFRVCKNYLSSGICHHF